MRVLVTGGAGFIGSHLSQRLCAEGHHIVVIDDLSSGRLSNLSGCVELIEFIGMPLAEMDLCSLEKFDAVFHLASQVSVQQSIQDFFNSSSSNLLGGLKVIEYCRLGAIPLVYASSAAVYGNLGYGDDSCEDTVDLLSPYAADKYMLEQYARIANKTHGFGSVGLRFFNVFGPRQNPNSAYSGVISIFGHQILNGKTITIFGGEQTRDFIYVETVVEALIRAMDVAFAITSAEVINILSGKCITINKLSDLLIQTAGTSVEKVFKPRLNGDPEKSSGSVTKMKSLLGIQYGDFMPFEAALDETLKSLAQHENQASN